MSNRTLSSVSNDTLPVFSPEAEGGFPTCLVIIALALGVLGLIALLRKKGGSKRRTASTLFIVGECGSGKTSLLYYLENKTIQRTTSSIKENEVRLTVPLGDGSKREIPCVDVPGHHHLRHIFFDRLNEAKGIIITVDSSDKSSLAGAADYIYKLMIHPIYRDYEIPTLIVLNKQDLATARRINIIEDELINEIEKLKISKRAIQEEADDEDTLKQEFTKFSFAGRPIKFCEASLNKDEVDQVTRFIQDLFE